jgi:predicted nucleotidyltransferase component of viral defense system
VPAKAEMLLGRSFLVESSAEIVAKKIWHRGADITARDIFDFAMVAEMEPDAMKEIAPILRVRREAVLDRIRRNERWLRESFELLSTLEYRRPFDDCVQILKEQLAKKYTEV